MSVRKKLLLFVCIVFVAFLSVYVFFVRDWYKPTLIDKHWIKCTVEKINTYNNITEISNDLMADGDFFNVGNQEDVNNGIKVVNNYFSFSIVPNWNSDKGFYNIGSYEDLNVWLDYEFGEFRPFFNLMSRKYNFDEGSCWISPNLRSKNEYGFTENNDDIVIVIFCKDFTITIKQSGWGGDKPFQRFFLLFYELLKYKQY